MPDSREVVLGEVTLEALRTQPALWQAFLDVQAPWIDAGVSRWLDLVQPNAPWPVFVIAAWSPEAPGSLLGTTLGVWAETPIARFDDLLEHACPQGFHGASRPVGGVWHFIAATASPHAAGLNLGRRLVGAALDWMQTCAPEARARTLSPAVGLPHLLTLLNDVDAVHEAVFHVANAKGQPALEILRLHLGAGAKLEAVLANSRRDEERSAHVTLRFAYPIEAAERDAQKQRYLTWMERRAAQIAAGTAKPLADPTLWQVADSGDSDVSGSVS